MSDEQPGPRTYLETFAALIRDRRISHGAFREWHGIRDYTNHASTCFPGQRLLAADIGCDIHSLKGWTEELVAAGWLKISKGKRGGFTYTVMDGNGQPLRKPTTLTDGEKHNTSVAEKHSGGDAETRNGLLRKPTTKVSSPVKSAQLSEGGGAPAPKISTGERISFEKELDAIAERRRQIINGACHDAWGPMYSAKEKVTLQELKAEKARLLKLLNRKY